MLSDDIPSRNSGNWKFFIVVGSLGVLLFVKFAFFAFFFTPLWEIPDESGHYSYVESLSKGTYPILGKAHMADDVTRSWLGPGKKPPPNWIAQHPPFYYLLDAPVVVLARAAGLDFEGQVRTARLLSSLSGALTVVGIILFITLATRDRRLGIAAGIFVAATPMFVHLSSGVSHDTMVACLASWSAYFLARWARSRSRVALCACAALMGLGAITKITTLAASIPLFGVMTAKIWFDESSQTVRERVLQAGKLWIIMFIAPGAWMVYNFVIFGKILPDASMLGSAPKLVPIGFFQYMMTEPFWQHTLLNYVALIGWTGMGHGTLHWVQADGYIAQTFVGMVLFAAMATTALTISQKIDIPIHSRWIMAILAVVTLYVVFEYSTMQFTAITCVMIFIALILTSTALVLKPRELLTVEFMTSASVACVLFFSFVYYHHLWSGYAGQMRATHGRYFYPVLPFIVYAFSRPFSRRGIGLFAIAGSLACLLVSDVYFLREISVFYGQF